MQICFSYHKQIRKIWLDNTSQKNAQTKDSFRNIPRSSKRKPDLVGTDRDRGFYSDIFQTFLNNNNIKLYSRNSSFGCVFVERFQRTIRDLLKKPVFESRDGNWFDVLPTITKQ